MMINNLAFIAFALNVCIVSGAKPEDKEQIESLLKSLRDSEHRTDWKSFGSFLLVDLYLIIQNSENNTEYDKKYFDNVLKEAKDIFPIESRTVSELFFEIGKIWGSKSLKSALEALEAKGNFDYEPLSKSFEKLDETNEKVFKEMLDYVRQHLLDPSALRLAYMFGTGELCELVNEHRIIRPSSPDYQNLSTRDKLSNLAYLTLQLEHDERDSTSASPSKIRGISILCNHFFSKTLNWQANKQFLFEQTRDDITFNANPIEPYVSHICDWNQSSDIIENLRALIYFEPEESREQTINDGRRLADELVSKCSKLFKNTIAKFGDERYVRWSKLIEEHINKEAQLLNYIDLNFVVDDKEPSWSDATYHSRIYIQSVFNHRFSQGLEKLIGNIMKKYPNALQSKCQQIADDSQLRNVHDTIKLLFELPHKLNDLLKQDPDPKSPSLGRYIYFVKVCKHLMTANWQVNSQSNKVFNWLLSRSP